MEDLERVPSPSELREWATTAGLRDALVETPGLQWVWHEEDDADAGRQSSPSPQETVSGGDGAYVQDVVVTIPPSTHSTEETKTLPSEALVMTTPWLSSRTVAFVPSQSR